jgi:alpha-D-ribose 1-methylphosphonate 5-triphosphate synthase subunit PhnG
MNANQLKNAHDLSMKGRFLPTMQRRTVPTTTGALTSSVQVSGRIRPTGQGFRHGPITETRHSVAQPDPANLGGATHKRLQRCNLRGLARLINKHRIKRLP